MSTMEKNYDPNHDIDALTFQLKLKATTPVLPYIGNSLQLHQIYPFTFHGFNQ